MGLSYNAVVVAADPISLLRCLKSLPEEYNPIQFYAYRVGDRGAIVFGYRDETGHLTATDEMERLADALSKEFDKAVAVHYDEMLQVYQSSLCQEGKWIRSFGEEDELWAPMDENGDEIADAPRCPGHAIPEGEDFAFVWDGIDAGLEAAGFRSWLPSSLHEAAHQDALIWQRPAQRE
jgi:hypothetical protein